MASESMSIRVAHMVHGCRTLGPGSRTVVWVRGCARRCPGCIATPILGDGPALELRARDLVDRVLATTDEGVTFSGGEPLEQAEALAEVAHLLGGKGRSVMVYTGYTLDELRLDESPAVAALLDATDILIDGPFERVLQADMLWRGSSNQRVHLLSPRYAGIFDTSVQPGVGVELRTDPMGRLFWAGVPPVGFAASLRRAAEQEGILLSASSGVWA